jgi:hypothetical protein
MDLYSFQSNAYKYTKYLIYFLYLIIALGLSSTAPAYLDSLIYYAKIYISLFLIVRFNPFREHKFTPLDAQIAFNAGTFLLFATAVNGIIGLYITSFRSHIVTFLATRGF